MFATVALDVNGVLLCPLKGDLPQNSESLANVTVLHKDRISNSSSSESKKRSSRSESEKSVEEEKCNIMVCIYKRNSFKILN